MTTSALGRRVRSWSLSGLLISAALLHPARLPAESVPVRHMEGTVHGFLAVRTMQGETIAAGDLLQVVQGDRLVSNLIFHFKDGSVDDETTVFSQHHDFRLISDHHVQKGPSFPHPMDVSIDASSGQVTVRSYEDGKEKVETDHLDLQPDVANGLLLDLLKNIPPHAPETKVSYVAATPKPRLVKLSIKPEGEETFWAAGVRGLLRCACALRAFPPGLCSRSRQISRRAAAPGRIGQELGSGERDEAVTNQGSIREAGCFFQISLRGELLQHEIRHVCARD